MQTVLQVMSPIYDKAESVWGTYSIDFFRFRHIFLSQKSPHYFASCLFCGVQAKIKKAFQMSISKSDPIPMTPSVRKVKFYSECGTMMWGRSIRYPKKGGVLSRHILSLSKTSHFMGKSLIMKSLIQWAAVGMVKRIRQK